MPAAGTTRSHLPWRPRARRASARAAASLLVLVLASLGLVTPRPAASAPAPYNIVLVVADDQRADTVTATYMPHVWDELVVGGRFFRNAFVPTPLCCPSRASILTGNYSHTTDVWGNDPDDGFGAFRDGNTIAVDLHRAGYRTALIGKYLNGYQAGTSRYVPPGWDRWFAIDPPAYYDYGATSDGRLRTFGSEAKDYVARVLSRRAMKFVKGAVDERAPFFLYYSFTAPHSPSIPDPRDLRRFRGETSSPRFDDHLESAYSIDRAVGRLVDVLPERTIVVYLSDNGLLWGEPKAGRGPLYRKTWPYDESIRIPLIVKALDGRFIPAAPSDDIVLNIDLRETLIAAAGLPPVNTDGKNLGASAYQARTVFPLEHRASKDGGLIPSYCGARERAWMYVRFGDGTEELYSEPDERSNLVDDAAYDAQQIRLRRAARSLCNPVPPGYSW
jgi:N-acetylglucosamine-6-sulfatase